MNARHQHHCPPPLLCRLFANGLDDSRAHRMGGIALALVIEAPGYLLGIGDVEGSVADKLDDRMEGGGVHLIRLVLPLGCAPRLAFLSYFAHG